MAEKPMPKADPVDDLFAPPKPAPAAPAPAAPAPAAPAPAPAPADPADPFAPAAPAPKPAPAAPAPAPAGAADPFAPAAPAPAAAPAAPKPAAPAPAKPDADPFADPFKISAEGLPIREWNDNTGTFRIEGRLIAILDGQVRILKTTGKTTTVPMRRLSEDDQKYVSEVVDRHGNGLIGVVAAR